MFHRCEHERVLRTVILRKQIQNRATAVPDANSFACRPLAGTRRRGKTMEEDKALQAELLADEKECSEHIMLVDLGRNDVGKVAALSTHKYKGESLA